MKLYLRYFIVGLFSSFSSLAISQNPELAKEYYENGEYEKAISIYEPLVKKDLANEEYMYYYISSLVEERQFSKAESILKKSLKKNTSTLNRFLLSSVYGIQDKTNQQEAEYDKIVNGIPGNVYQVDEVARQFEEIGELEYAIACYKRAEKKVGDYSFSLQLASLYAAKGDKENMVKSYLDVIYVDPEIMPMLQTQMFQQLDKEDYSLVQEELYMRIQEDSESVVYPELLTWIFVKDKQYAKALRQAKALDRKLEESGRRVYDIGISARQDKSYDDAIEAFEYVKSKGKSYSYYYSAQRELLQAKKLKITDSYSYTKEDLVALQTEYAAFSQEYGMDARSADLYKEWAEFEAFYMNDLSKAKELLQKGLKIPRAKKNTVAETKVMLGDVYLMEGDQWEATLLYSQVDKMMEEDVLGQLARFKNAKLAYYFGDFEWAQIQFDILKIATSRTISNDAIDLSVFILDNIGLDTVTRPMELFAEADLLVFQNKYDEAIIMYDKIIRNYPNHALEDDVVYAKANMAMKRQQIDLAMKYYEQIVDSYPESIRLDNALFALAELNENVVGDKKKAMEYYELIVFEHSDSTFMVEARKRFRALSGEL